MNANLRALAAACDEAGVSYRLLHEDGNLLLVHTPSGNKLFANWTTPLNSHAAARLCEDKDYAYSALSAKLPMPRTRAFLNPSVDEKYRGYLRFLKLPEIAAEIERSFSYPLILKRNRGSHGSNVFKISGPEALQSGLTTLFDQGSKDYDYVALAQEYIDVEQEYRSLFLDGELIFSYLKDTSNAGYSGNLSPFYRPGAKAVPVAGAGPLEDLGALAGEALRSIGVRYAGVDIARDRAGTLWVIEVNASPGFEFVVRDGGQAEVMKLYRRMLAALSAPGLG